MMHNSIVGHFGLERTLKRFKDRKDTWEYQRQHIRYPSQFRIESFCDPREMAQIWIWPGLSLVPYPGTGILDMLLL